MHPYIKKLWKPFILIFILSIFIINWSELSWIFNWRALLRYTSDFFDRKDRTVQTIATTTKESAVLGGNVVIITKENSIEIPKIGLEAPLIVNENFSDEDVLEALDGGTVYYPGSVLPGKEGQTIILGHSAPENWPKIKYDWVFSRINDLEAGDEITVYFNYKKTVYKVSEKIFLDKGEGIPNDGSSYSENVLILISCWPPGKDYKRIAVIAKNI